MIKLTLLVFVLSIIATGFLQEISNSLPKPPSSGNDTGTTKQIWIQQLGLRRSSGKPCSRKSNLNGPWVPSYSSRIVRPLHEPAILQPQALKNDDYRRSQISAHNENDQLFNDDQSELRSRSDDDDCDIQTVTDSANSVALSELNAEKTALKILEDCLKKKQNNLEAPKIGSRRSNSGPELNSDNNYQRDASEVDNLLTNNDVNNNEREERLASPKDQDIKHQILAVPIERAGTSPINMQPIDRKHRTCYACSTATNPTCWEPNERTTIKYCTREHSCVTKTFGVKNQVTLIRDCANTCEDTSVPGIEPKYKTCKLCHNDYCNSAMGVAGNIYSIASILIISIIKCTY